MTSVSSRPEPINLSSRVQHVQCLILSPSSWKLSTLNHRNVQLLHILALHYQPSIKLISTAICSLPQRVSKMIWIRRLLSLFLGSICHYCGASPVQCHGVQSTTVYKPPNRDAIRNKWLEKCHDRYQAMQQDGWSTIKIIQSSLHQWSAKVKASLWMLRIQSPSTRLLIP